MMVYDSETVSYIYIWRYTNQIICNIPIIHLIDIGDRVLNFARPMNGTM